MTNNRVSMFRQAEVLRDPDHPKICARCQQVWREYSPARDPHCHCFDHEYEDERREMERIDNRKRYMEDANERSKAKQRIAELERTVGEQADQIGGLTSELEQLRDVYTATAELLQIREEQVQQLLKDVSDSQQQLATSQAEAAVMRRALKQCRTFIYDWIHEYVDEQDAEFAQNIADEALATPSVAAERVQALEDVAKAARIYNRLYRLFRREGQQLRAALATLDAATDRNPRTVEEVKGE